MRTYEHELPASYREVKSIDATKPAVGLVFNLLSILPFFVLVPLFLSRYTYRDVIASPWRLAAIGLLLIGMVAYILLHELTHGLAYKCLTGQKLTFGLSWSCAFCGVPGIYCYRRTMLIAVTAPFVVFSLVLIPLFIVAMLTDAAFAMATGILLGLHLGGCSGDLYVTLLLLFVYRDERLLMRDTGPKQTFYLPCDESTTEQA